MKTQFEKDQYLHAYFDAVGPWHMARDLGMTEKAVKARVTRLKRCGAWDALTLLRRAERRLTAAYFDSLGIRHHIDAEDEAA